MCTHDFPMHSAEMGSSDVIMMAMKWLLDFLESYTTFFLCAKQYLGKNRNLKYLHEMNQALRVEHSTSSQFLLQAMQYLSSPLSYNYIYCLKTLTWFSLLYEVLRKNTKLQGGLKEGCSCIAQKNMSLVKLQVILPVKRETKC